MAERLNNLLFHAARAREMAMEGAPTIPKEERTIHGRAWKFSRGSYPVIGGTRVTLPTPNPVLIINLLSITLFLQGVSRQL